MERRDSASVATFFAPDPLEAGQTALLGEEVAHHMRVRRVELGDAVRLVDGVGGRALGTLRRLAKGSAHVEVGASVEQVPHPVDIHLLVPVADRERMLWLAEKVTELGISSWRPVTWKRSRSVSPRGEGAAFHAKVRSRMTGALEQSGRAWLPTLYPDAPLDRALVALPEGGRLLLVAGGVPLLSAMRGDDAPQAPIIIAAGPEGGMEDDEVERFTAAGFRPIGLGDGILRFETAALAALAVLRASLTS